jgi:hypothetical protein
MRTFPVDVYAGIARRNSEKKLVALAKWASGNSWVGLNRGALSPGARITW